MFKTTIDLCKVRNSFETNFIGKMMIPNSTQSSYYHTQCPIKKGYYSKDYKVDDKLIPTYLNKLKARYIQKMMIKPVNAKKMVHCFTYSLYCSFVK